MDDDDMLNYWGLIENILPAASPHKGRTHHVVDKNINTLLGNRFDLYSIWRIVRTSAHIEPSRNRIVALANIERLGDTFLDVVVVDRVCILFTAEGVDGGVDDVVDATDDLEDDDVVARK